MSRGGGRPRQNFQMRENFGDCLLELEEALVRVGVESNVPGPLNANMPQIGDGQLGLQRVDLVSKWPDVWTKINP